MRVHAFEWVQDSGCTSADVSGCLYFPDMRAALLLNSCSPNSGVQFIAVAVYNFFSDRTNQNDDVFPGPPFFSRSVGEPTWFSEMLWPVTVCVHIYIYIYILAQNFQVVMVSLFEKRQGKQGLCKLEKKMELALTNIVDPKSIFAEGGF